jgi:hypothetical protein
MSFVLVASVKDRIDARHVQQEPSRSAATS